MRANNEYLLSCYEKIRNENPGAIALDFGCGDGEIVAEARRRGYEFYGADTFYGKDAFAEESAQRMDSAVRSFIHRIDAGNTGFPDSYFDFICSNQVFEHIEDLDVVISELARIAKPSSIQVHLFPTLEVFIDGHTYVPFIHRLPRGMPRRMISRLWYYSGRARFGATTSSFHAWYAVFAAFLVEDTHYRSWPTIRSAFEQKFYIRRLDKDKLLGRLQLRSGLKFRLMTKIVQWVPDIVIGRVEIYRSGIALELRKRNDLQRK